MKGKKLFTEKRMLIGLLGLLFVMGMVHTMGILSLSNKMASRVASGRQTAQVATLSICLQITPAYNMTDAAAQNNPPNFTLIGTQMYWNVKNMCNYNVRIVNSGAVFSPSSPSLFTLQTRHSNGSILQVTPQNYATYDVSNYAESTSCSNCGSSGYVQYPSNAGAQTFVDTYLIAPQMTRTIIASGSYLKENGSDWSIRFVPKYIKWVPQSSVADNYITSTDIITTAIPSEQALYWASDFIKEHH